MFLAAPQSVKIFTNPDNFQRFISNSIVIFANELNLLFTILKLGKDSSVFFDTLLHNENNFFNKQNFAKL